MNTNTTKNKQVAIVTGASSGMGLGITPALLELDYQVVANSRNISKSRDLKASSRPHSCGWGHQQNGLGHKSG
jgi:NAD(P)-dependent dehydrogenase (short-subunit alcohol dehydrogenase family)